MEADEWAQQVRWAASIPSVGDSGYEERCRGSVSTVTADGSPLAILFIYKAPANEQLASEVRVLTQFASALRRREPVRHRAVDEETGYAAHK